MTNVVKGAGIQPAMLAGASPKAQAAGEETQIVRRAQRGDTEAYEELVRRHQRRVFAVASGILRQSFWPDK